MLKWIPLVWANLTRRRLRTALTIVSVAASFTLFGLLESFRYSVTTFADDYSNALVVQSRNVRLPYSHVTRLLGMPGVESACGYLVGFVELAQKKRLMLQAVPDRDVFTVHPGISVAPEALERWHQDRLAALIDADLAVENGWKVGDRVMLPATKRGLRFQRADGVNALEVVIVGVFSSTNALASGRIFVRYDYVRDVVGPDRAGLEFIAVRFSPALDVDRIPMASGSELQALRTALDTNPRLQLQVVSEREYQSGLAANLIARVQSLAFALTLLLGIGAVVATINTTYNSIAARERCLSTLRAIGFDNVSVAAAVFLEALLLGSAGGAAGGIIAWSLVSGWGLSLLNTETHTPVALDAAVTLTSLFYGVLSGISLGALAAVLPSISVARKDIATTLRF